MEESILQKYPNAETFLTFWNNHYNPLSYDDVKESFEDFVTSASGHIYLSDYEEKNCILKDDFIENLSTAAQFTFQDMLTEVFYDKNPDLYETAFSIYEEEQLAGRKGESIAQVFHDTFSGLYREFLNRLFDEKLSMQ